MEDNKKNEQDYLLQFLKETDTNNMGQSKQHSQPNINSYEQMNNEAQNNMEFLTFDAKLLPLGMFYQNGTIILFRAAKVKEIQAYSMLDDNNYYDMIEKMNEMLASCVRVKYPNGTIMPYTDIKDGDRLFVILLIRQMTFKSGNSLTVNKTCSCTTDVSIELAKENFVFYKMNSELEEYYNPELKAFSFNLINGKTYTLAPPSIGLQKSFTQYIIREYNDKKAPKMAFLKIVPFLCYDKKTMSYEEIKAKLVEFENMDDISFQFLNDAVNSMTFGIKELKKTCPVCSLEVNTEMVFPNGASSLFIVSSALNKYIKK